MFKKNNKQHNSTSIYGMVDERTKTIVYRGDAYTGRFMLFALLIDIFIKGLHLNTPFITSNWDLMFIVIIGGLISTVYQIKNKVLSYKSSIGAFIAIALFTALIAFLIVYLL